MSTAQLPTESGEQFAAFTYYCELGPAERSHPKVAARGYASERTINRWAKTFRWVERAHAYDAGLAQARAELEVPALETVVEGLLERLVQQAADLARGFDDVPLREHVASVQTLQKLLDAIESGVPSRADGSTFDGTRLSPAQAREFWALVAKIDTAHGVVEVVDPMRELLRANLKTYVTAVKKRARGEWTPHTTRALDLLARQIARDFKKMKKQKEPAPSQSEHELHRLTDAELERLECLLAIAHGQPMPERLRVGSASNYCEYTLSELDTSSVNHIARIYGDAIATVIDAEGLCHEISMHDLRMGFAS